ncbi:MAG: hypothetical protein OXM61_15670 [Candidatus Poribacteria bacterium]|nr:hypothetical protein [Candidatus Poribacteria bacterium]
MKRFISILFLMGFGVCLLTSAVSFSDATTATTEPHPSTKRVAVLDFEDNSRFDSSTGCGCVPNFIGKIFGTKKKWNLEAGFRTLLNRKLAETTVYQPVSRDELLDAMAQMALSRHNLKKLDKEQRATLAKLLNADVLVMGEIKKFSHTGMKANASRTLREGGREGKAVPTTTSYRTGAAVMGYRYRSNVTLNLKIYEASGSEIATVPISVTRSHVLAGTQVSGLEATVTESGTNLRLGQTSEQYGQNSRPIVSPAELSKTKFATPKYDRTLIGMATNDALIKAVLALRDNYGPNFLTPWDTPVEDNEQEKKVDEEALKRPIKITYVESENPDQIYINAGSARGLAIDQKFDVYTDGKPIRDIDTGEILDYVPKKIATVAVVEIRNDRLSVVKIVEKTSEIKKGDLLKSIPTEEVTKEQ